MQKKSITLTPNRRLARHLHAIPLATWLENCWRECNDQRALLNSHQERLLWQQIIEEILGKEFNGIASTIMEAYELVTNWQLNIANWNGYELYESYESEDIIIFKRLNKKFEEYCRTNNLVTTCKLPSLLLPYLQDYNLKITLSSFDEYSPQFQTLIDNLKNLNYQIYHNDSNNYKNSKLNTIGFDKQCDEITTVARWAKKLITSNPKISIGVIAINLKDLRSEIIRIFNNVLGGEENFNISAGAVFSSLPIISSALELLVLIPSEPFELKKISKILLSPYIHGAEVEKSNRAIFDFKLHSLGQIQFRLSDIEFLAKKYSINIPILINILQSAHDIFTQVKNKKLCHSDWIKIFIQILQILGWPSENNLTDYESEAIKRFTELLDEFALTDLIARKTYMIQALHTLRSIADQTIFQPIQKTESQINILGYLEAAGINFDYLWVIGLDQESWPTSSTPNPFIPIKVQKKFALPHSSAQRELHFCTTLINRFKRSAREVIFSYVKQIEDRVIGPSSLIADIQEICISNLDLAAYTPLAKEIYNSKKLVVTDTDDYSFTPISNEVIYGGSRLIELQSLCPFRAFVEFRLTTKELKQFEPGISKLKRGILIHATLEEFWKKVKTHQNLCKYNQDDLHNLIIKSIEYALNKENLSQNLYLLEKKCLIRLLTRWLEIEKNRPPFEVIATEKIVQTTLGTLQISLRIDRIDRLENGNLLIIDYKTGKKLPAVFDWFGVRPKNPQLPLYCVASGEAQGLAFAQINIESIKFKNIGLDELAFGLRTADENNFKNNINWQGLIEYWQEILTNLTKDFVSGIATPKPLSPEVCKQCEFGIICRYTNNAASCKK